MIYNYVLYFFITIISMAICIYAARRWGNMPTFWFGLVPVANSVLAIGVTVVMLWNYLEWLWHSKLVTYAYRIELWVMHESINQEAERLCSVIRRTTSRPQNYYNEHSEEMHIKGHFDAIYLSVFTKLENEGSTATLSKSRRSSNTLSWAVPAAPSSRRLE